MLFSYMLHFVAVITSVSVLATPLPYGATLPDEGKLFDFSGGEGILSDVGKDLARGNWRRTAHPDKLKYVERGTSIGDFLSLGNVKSNSRSFFEMFYCGINDGAEAIAKKVHGKPFVEDPANWKDLKDNKPEALVTASDKLMKLIGVWNSVEHPGTYIVIFGRLISGPETDFVSKFVRKLTPDEVKWVEKVPHQEH